MSSITYTDYIAMQAKLAKATPQQARETESPVTRERDLHATIMAECRQRGWICFHGSMAHPTYRTAGEPDCIVVASGGRVFFVECKRRGGKLSPEQFALKHQAEGLGHTIHVIHSYQAFLDLL